MADGTPKDENKTTTQPVTDPPVASVGAPPVAAEAPPAAGAQPAAGAPPVAEDVPDPDDDEDLWVDEDDLSDLDDVLDEFAGTKPSAPMTSGPGRPAAAGAKSKGKAAERSMPAAGLANPFGIEDDEEFAKLMQAGMADLLGGPKPKPKTTLDPNNIFAEMVKEMSSVAHSDGPEADALREALGITKEDTIIPPSSETEPGGAKAQSAFQQTIRQTIERMQESGAAAGAAAASSSKPEDDYLAALLRDLENGDTGASGDGDDDFSKLLMGVMQQLTNKDILYEPMKDMNDKFPDWMEKNKGKHSDEDMKRYAEQQTLASEIVAKFEEPNYRDSKVEDREYIVDKMGKMQAAGAPPADLVGDMAAAQDALGDLDSGCPQQ